MEPKSWERVDLWVADLMGVPLSMLWQEGVTVGMHSGLGDFPGLVVLGRKGGVHVSLPDWANRKMIDELVEQPPADLMSTKFWKHYAPTADLKVVGPTVHSFTDTQLEAPSKIEQLPASDISAWADVMSRRKWEESGFAGDAPVAFALRAGEEIAAASNLTLFRGVPSDVGVLTHPKHRGKGYSSRVARAATAYAVRSHDIARYRYDPDNARTRTIASSLGFEAYFEEITVRPR